MFIYFNSWIQGTLCDITKGSYPYVVQTKEVNNVFFFAFLENLATIYNG